MSQIAKEHLSDNPHFCARCAKVEPQTCCQWAEIYITPGDCFRIAAALKRGSAGVEQGEFYHFVAPENPVYLDQDDDPLWEECVFRPDGTRRVLKQVNGSCPFLGQMGCLLDMQTRPLICRLYPFSYNAEGITEELSSGCPEYLLEPGESLLAVLNMNKEQALLWHEQIYREIQEEPHRKSVK